MLDTLVWKHLALCFLQVSRYIGRQKARRKQGLKMSTFSGRVLECDWLSIDHFKGTNLNSVAFFLSHCHQDHMIGLADDVFYELLTAKNYRLYCHTITKILLESHSRYSRLANFIEGKNYGETFTVEVPKGDNDINGKGNISNGSVKVTLMDAHHCLGSAMILLEFEDGKRALYTGDLRLTKKDWFACEPLRDPYSNSGFKSIDSFYFDSTFCRKGTEVIPSEAQSKELLLKMVSEWLDLNKSNKVLIWGTSYGQEFLMHAIYEKMGFKCHVAADKYQIYSKIPGYADFVTCFAKSTPIHACTMGINAMDEVYEERKQTMVKSKNRKYKPQVFPCNLCRPDNKVVRVIRPSVIWFARRSEKECVVGYDHQYFCRLLYSNHCSFVEIEDAFKILRPVRAFPNVVDMKLGLEHVEKIMAYLNRYLHGAATSDIKVDVKSFSLKRLHSSTYGRNNLFCEASSSKLMKQFVKQENGEVNMEEKEANYIAFKESKSSASTRTEVKKEDADSSGEDDCDVLSQQKFSQETIVLSD